VTSCPAKSCWAASDWWSSAPTRESCRARRLVKHNAIARSSLSRVSPTLHVAHATAGAASPLRHSKNKNS